MNFVYFSFDILQIENPRYLREKPVPLDPVSCQGAPFSFVYKGPPGFILCYLKTKGGLSITISILAFLKSFVGFQVQPWEEQHFGGWWGPAAFTKQGAEHRSEQTPTMCDK